MEIVVGAEGAKRITASHRAVVRALKGAKVSEAGGIERQSNLGGSSGLEQAPNAVNLLDLIGAEIGHRGAAVTRPIDQPHALELAQSLTDDVALGSEPRHQLVFDQPFPGEQPAKDDVGLKLVNNESQGAVQFAARRFLASARLAHSTT